MDRREYQRAYYLAHRKELLEKRRAYAAAHQEEIAAYYRANRERQAARHRARQRGPLRDFILAQTRANNERNRRALNALKDAPCMDCGGRFPPECMDFDHRDPSTKVQQVSHLVGTRALRDEIAKCDLVCANCHRIRTFARRRRNSAA